MTASPDPSLAARALDLARRGLTRRGAPAELPGRLLVIDTERQLAVWLEDGKATGAWPVSTARAGIGGAESSFRTPPGWHQIRARIGEDAAPGTVFVSREPTGETWRGEVQEDDLILTRILTLEGLEDGVNRGPGCDSLARYIYLHGTNHESMLGRPVSHGCVRFSNADVCDLFVRLHEGDLVFVAAPDTRSIPDPRGEGRFHYAGLGGSGMSALAQFQLMTGGKASGSDRAFDRGERAALRAQLERLGMRGAAAGRERPRSRLRRARRLDGRRKSGGRRRRGPHARHPHHSSLGAARAFCRRLSLDRRDRDQRQIDRDGDDLRHPERRGP